VTERREEEERHGDLRDQISHLHRHLDKLSTQIDHVQCGQAELHRDHLSLAERVDGLERAVEEDRHNLNHHIETADIMRQALIDTMMRIESALLSHIKRFDKHDQQEQSDRREVNRSLRNTMISLVGLIATLLLGGFTLLWQTGVLYHS